MGLAPRLMGLLGVDRAKHLGWSKSQLYYSVAAKTTYRKLTSHYAVKMVL
jgi:hypothetical protein